MTSDFKTIIDEIEKRYSEILNTRDRESFILNLKSLVRWNNEPLDYKEPKEIIFPESLNIAYAVCHPECGVEELIVDGSTQRCQKCGSLLYRTKVTEYTKKI